MSEITLFGKGDKAPSTYFTGTTWIKFLVPNDPTLHTQIANVIFEPGSINHWHTHPGGQILVVTEGVGYYQEKGKSVRIIRKGEVVIVAPDIEHWHGASPDQGMTHLAINPNTQKGVVVWLHAVTDEEYKAKT